jgi:peptidoglycan hydrolase-like protein with peptidoglycan-binding domain
MKKNKYLPYVLFGVPLLIGVYFVLKNLKVKGRNQSQEPETPPSNPVKDAVKGVKDIIIGYTNNNKLPFKKGQQGENIKVIQQALGLNMDGKFGSMTESKVIEFQNKHKLKADGIVGKNTWYVLMGADFPYSDATKRASIQQGIQNVNQSIDNRIPNVSATNQPKPFDFNKPFGF